MSRAVGHHFGVPNMPFFAQFFPGAHGPLLTNFGSDHSGPCTGYLYGAVDPSPSTRPSGHGSSFIAPSGFESGVKHTVGVARYL